MLRAIHLIRSVKTICRAVIGPSALFLSLTPSTIFAQSVSEIITDYNGYWKSGSSAINSVKPDNNHNLVAFTFNGTRYSTGVNDALLTAQSQTFTPASFRALPMQNINGTPNSNTKVGLGAMIDGVYNGAGPAPSRNLGQYLNDGPQGLNIGTCVANLPAGTMFMSVSNLQTSSIGDGIPDIIVTQIADPSTQYDRYEFTDVNGNRIGNYLDIVLTNITPVGVWTADFYEATGSTILQSGFTQTDRSLRLWAADFSAFGINASNIQNIAYFKIQLNGNSDIGFVAYNDATLDVNSILDIPEENTGRISRNVEREDVKQVSLYPNPAGSFIHVSHPVSAGAAKISVYGINGVLLKDIPVKQGVNLTRIDLAGVRSGTYHAVFSDGVRRQAVMFIVR